MRKYRMKMTNALNHATWCRVNLTHLPNSTTNSSIPNSIFVRECKEYDAGVLKPEHDTYLGERYV